MSSLSAVIIGIKSFPRRLMDTVNAMPKRKRIATIIGLIIFILLILFIIGYAIYLKATGNQIVNYATFTYTDESNIPRTIISNPVTIDILETPSGNVNLTYQLQGVKITADQSDTLTLNVYQPGTTTAVINQVSLDGNAQGSASAQISINNGTYDFVLKGSKSLSNRLSNIFYNSSTSPLNLSFDILRQGDFNNNSKVETQDFSMLKTHWFQNYPDVDLNKDGSINSGDFAILVSNFGKVGG